MTTRLRLAAARLRREVGALIVARRDPRVPMLARVVIVLTVAYAVSPIDLIPDVIPVLGLLDDLLIVPAGLWLALRLVPEAVMAEARAAADEEVAASLRHLGFRLVVAVWIGAVVGAWWLFRRVS